MKYFVQVWRLTRTGFVLYIAIQVFVHLIANKVWHNYFKIYLSVKMSYYVRMSKTLFTHDLLTCFYSIHWMRKVLFSQLWASTRFQMNFLSQVKCLSECWLYNSLNFCKFYITRIYKYMYYTSRKRQSVLFVMSFYELWIGLN